MKITEWYKSLIHDHRVQMDRKRNANREWAIRAHEAGGSVTVLERKDIPGHPGHALISLPYSGPMPRDLALYAIKRTAFNRMASEIVHG